jgi:transposase
MIVPPPGVHVWLACGYTDMRKGFDGLSALAQQQFGKDPFSVQLFVFPGKRGSHAT